MRRQSKFPSYCCIVFAAFWCTFGCPDPAQAECLRRQPAGEPGRWCTVDGTHVRVWWNQSPGAPDEERKATAIRDEIENHLWPLFEGLLGRTPLSDGDLRLYSASNG